jgi:hypothetical protein
MPLLEGRAQYLHILHLRVLLVELCQEFSDSFSHSAKEREREMERERDGERERERARGRENTKRGEIAGSK